MNIYNEENNYSKHMSITLMSSTFDEYCSYVHDSNLKHVNFDTRMLIFKLKTSVDKSNFTDIICIACEKQYVIGQHYSRAEGYFNHIQIVVSENQYQR